LRLFKKTKEHNLERSIKSGIRTSGAVNPLSLIWGSRNNVPVDARFKFPSEISRPPLIDFDFSGFFKGALTRLSRYGLWRGTPPLLNPFKRYLLGKSLPRRGLGPCRYAKGSKDKAAPGKHAHFIAQIIYAISK
jgi:hypothetical protein